MKYRLINCEFVKSSAFRNALSNKAQLLYYNMLVSSDDRGFVDNLHELLSALLNSDSGNELFTNYEIALNELVDRGYIYLFTDNHNNKIALIRHFFYHNKKSSSTTNYRSFLKYVVLEDGKYTLKNQLKGKPIIKGKEMKGNEEKRKEDSNYFNEGVYINNEDNYNNDERVCEDEIKNIIDELENMNKENKDE